MYSTCLHCHAPLGTNESIEAFPVGKRLAFDAAKGRLWVICPACGRWNLTPLEERWEAVEDCERQFREARRRVTKGEIGLAHLASGARLVRIGAPTPHEMAAWRYGRVLQRRWWTRGLPVVAAVTVIGGSGQFLAGYTPDTFVPLGVLLAAGGVAAGVFNLRSGVRLAMPNGRVAKVRGFAARKASLQPDGERWTVAFGKGGLLQFEGAAAQPALRGLLTLTNFTGARQQQIDSALELLAAARDPHDYITRLARASAPSGVAQLGDYPDDVRCALEMALHDDAERRAMEGELDDLLAEWQQAEQIAQIADDMFLPQGIEQRIGDIRSSR